jgi:DNA polymerase III delta prime subunit
MNMNMESSLNTILNRDTVKNEIKSVLFDIDKNKSNCLCKRGIYIYGNPGTGKTSFISNVLKEMNYDMIHYNAGDIRNKSVIETITQHNMSDTNVLSLLQKKSRKIVIVMDEIDGMNNGDKGGITSLIKLIRPKKTKKQRQEDLTLTPIICIGNYHMDKKIKELMKVCTSFELKDPTSSQVGTLLDHMMLSSSVLDYELKNNLINYIQGDLRKLKVISEIYINQQNILKTKVIRSIFQPKTYNEDSKTITRRLLERNYNLSSHANFMNETDRTIVGLLWHENIVDKVGTVVKNTFNKLMFYDNVLDNICFADYIDRVTFQKQIWQFNEMSSLIKTFYNNYIFHVYSGKIASTKQKKGKKKGVAASSSSSPPSTSTLTTSTDYSSDFSLGIQTDMDDLKHNVHSKPCYDEDEIRFTKVLTKYSTEYNNYMFIQNLCIQMLMDKNDLITYFLHVRSMNKSEEDICSELEQYSVSKLDVSRMFRYLDKYRT